MYKSVLDLRANQYSIIIVSLLLASLISIFPNYILISAIVLCTIIIIYIYGEIVLFGIVILFYLTSPTEYIGEFRVYSNFILTGLLIYIFLTKYGTEFHRYPKVPIEILLFLILLFFTLFSSTIFSEYPATGLISIWTTLAFFIIVYLLYAHLYESSNINFYIMMISLSVLMLSIRLFLDLFQLGVENFLARAVVASNTDLYGSSGYTGFTIIFISVILLFAKLQYQKLLNKKYNLFLIFIILLHLLILIAANSRALLVSSILGISFLLYTLKPRQFIKTIILMSVISVLAIFSLPFVYELVELYLRLDTVTQRDIFWESGVQVIKRNLIFGVGPGTFQNYFFSYAPSSVFSFLDLEIWKLGKPTPHSFFLYYWAENGIMGIITSISLFVVFFTIASRTIKIVKLINKELYFITLAITGIGIGMLFRSFFESTGILYYGFITTDLPFWLVFIILIFIYQHTKTQLRLK